MSLMKNNKKEEVNNSPLSHMDDSMISRFKTYRVEIRNKPKKDMTYVLSVDLISKKLVYQCIERENKS